MDQEPLPSPTTLRRQITTTLKEADHLFSHLARNTRDKTTVPEDTKLMEARAWDRVYAAHRIMLETSGVIGPTLTTRTERFVDRLWKECGQGKAEEFEMIMARFSASNEVAGITADDRRINKEVMLKHVEVLLKDRPDLVDGFKSLLVPQTKQVDKDCHSKKRRRRL